MRKQTKGSERINTPIHPLKRDPFLFLPCVLLIAACASVNYQVLHTALLHVYSGCLLD